MSWRVAAAQADPPEMSDPLEHLDADVIALQSVRSRVTRRTAEALDYHHAWVPSHHPRSRLLPGSAVGLAILTPHRITLASETVIGHEHSLWSPRRRIAQTVTVMRADRSAYAISHRSSDEPGPAFGQAVGSAPLVVVQPGGPDRFHEPTITVPDGAVVTDSTVTSPLADTAPLVCTRFDMTWAAGGFISS